MSCLHLSTMAFGGCLPFSYFLKSTAPGFATNHNSLMVASVPRFEESRIPLQDKVGGCWIAGRLLSHLAFSIFTGQIYNQNKKIAYLNV